MKLPFIKRILWIVLLTLFFEASLYAVEISPRTLIPTVSDPGLIQQRLKFRGPFRRNVLSTEVVQPEEKKQTEAAASLKKITFTLKKVIFKGNTVYSDDNLQAIFKPYYHKTISIADLQDLVKKIGTQYHRDGYLLSRAILPPQVIKEGIVTIQVIEGYISDVQYQGNAGAMQCVLMKYGNKIIHDRPFQIATLQRNMLLMNDLPGIDVQAVIKPSKTVPASADLYLVVHRTYADTSLTYDNYGTRYIGPQQITFRTDLYSASVLGDSDTIRLITVPRTSELRYAEYLHLHPIQTNGLNWTFGGSYSESHPLFILSPFNIQGRSSLLFTGLNYPILRERTKNVYVHSSVNYQNVSSTILGAPFYYDRFRTLIVGGNADLEDRFRGSNSVGADLEHGFDIMGAGFHVNQSRPLGVSDFTKFTFNLARLQWFTERVSLLGAMRAQYACNPLLATEQYAYGGADFGRGYDPSEIVGDDGLAAKLELRLNAFPELRFLQATQYYVFYDGGEIWNRDGTNLPPKQSAFSTGFGIRFNFLPQLSANFFLAKPLTRPVATLQAINQDGNQIRTFFQIVASV